MLARSGVKAQIYDVVNSHLRHLHDCLTSPPVELGEIVNSRQRVMSDLLQVISVASGRRVQLCDIKTLVLAVTYGGSAKKHLKALGCDIVCPWLLKFQSSLRQIAQEFADAMPERIVTLNELDKRDPAISLLSYIGADLQRKTTDAMGAAVTAKGRVCSFERDCIVGVGKATFAEVSAAAGVPITLETYDNEDAVVALLKVKFPFTNFTLNSEFDFDELAEARRCCMAALQPVVKPAKADAPVKMTFPKPKNTTDFGMVVGAHLEPRVICGEGKAMEYWGKSSTCCHGQWYTVADRDSYLTKLTRSALLTLFLPTKMELVKGHMFVPKVHGIVPPPCKDRGFYLGVAGDVGLVLRRPRPPSFADNIETRRFLQDRQGLIYDFDLDCFHAGDPSIRVSLNLPWEFFRNGAIGTPDSVWDVPQATKQGLLERLDRIFDYYLKGSAEGKSLHADPIWGQPLAKSLLSFVEADPHCKVWKLLVPFMSRDMDKLLWLLNQCAADSAAWVRRTEFNYMWGEGGCGKDVLFMLLLQFHGDRKLGGYAATFPQDYFVGKNSKSDLKTTLDTAKAARLVINNEVTEHVRMNHDEIKALTESRGTGITSRLPFSRF
jgi:hypothetical protein